MSVNISKEHYENKFLGYRKALSERNRVKVTMKARGISDEVLRADLKSNNEEFRMFVRQVALSAENKSFSSSTHAAVMSLILDMYGMPYTVKVGTAFVMDEAKNYSKNKADMEKRMEQGKEPMFNHVWVESNGVIYEDFFNCSSNIDHVYSEEITAR